MNNTLTAKEWLEKETFRDGIMTSKNKEKLMLSDLAERYANYKNRILEDRIAGFRKIIDSRINLLSASSDWETGYEKDALDNLIKEYDKHFNINKGTT